jgi:hypothetical protein
VRSAQHGPPQPLTCRIDVARRVNLSHSVGLTFPKIRSIIRRIPTRCRGAFRERHEMWAGMRWTWRCRETSGYLADGEVVWSWRAPAGAKLAMMLSRRVDDGGKRWFTEESTYKP